MLNHEHYTELIDSYLKGKLNTVEASKLEQDIADNPLLNNEFQLQSSIFSAIQNARKAELKERLNNIQPNSSIAQLWKYAAILAVVSSAGFLGYYLSQNNTQEPVSQTSASPTKTEQVIAESANPAQPLEADSKAIPTTAVTSEKSASTMEEKTEKVSAKQKKKRDTNSTSDILPSSPSVHAPDASVIDVTGKELEAPSHHLTISPNLGSTVSGVEVVKSKKHKFHYRYFDSKLFLYGNFNSDTYEILELNTSKGQKLYLKFEKNYYTLEHNKTEISKLELVKDKVTLKELEVVQTK
jgi:hypothetical protein